MTVNSFTSTNDFSEKTSMWYLFIFKENIAISPYEYNIYIMYVCMHTCMYVYMYVCIYVYMYVCMVYACMYGVCMYVCMYVYMYIVCIYVCCMYVCMHVCIYLY